MLNNDLKNVNDNIQQAIISRTLTENKRNKFKKFISDIKNLNIDIDKLDFIRIFISKVGYSFYRR